MPDHIGDMFGERAVCCPFGGVLVPSLWSFLAFLVVALITGYAASEVVG